MFGSLYKKSCTVISLVRKVFNSNLTCEVEILGCCVCLLERSLTVRERTNVYSLNLACLFLETKKREHSKVKTFENVLRSNPSEGVYCAPDTDRDGRTTRRQELFVSAKKLQEPWEQT